MLGVLAVLETCLDEQKGRGGRAIKYACGEHLNAEDGEARDSGGRGSAWIKSIPAKQIGDEQLPNPIRPKIHNTEPNDGPSGPNLAVDGCGASP
jgi:hypothetical protein